jgi:hypothetical protein
MSEIRIFNSAYPIEGIHNARHIALEEVSIKDQNISVYGKPYILFEHKDYPLGALMAFYDGTYWQCDLD